MGKLIEKVKPGIAPLPQGMPFLHPVVLISTWCGAGLLRPAPGTIGSLAAIPLGYVIALLFGATGLIVAIILLLIVGTIAADRYGKKSGTVDDQSIVVDEVVGIWIAALPAADNIYLWLAAFLLFRFFDIWKPWPASYFDKRSRGGFDVMMDDMVAGIYALFGVSVGALALLA